VKEEMLESEILATVQGVVDEPCWAAGPGEIDRKILKILERLLPFDFKSFFFVHRDFGKRVAQNNNLKFGGQGIQLLHERTQDVGMTLTLFDALISILENCLRFPQKVTGKESLQKETIGAFVEQLLAMPETYESLYNFAMAQDQLSLTKFFKDVGYWSFLHIQRDREKKPSAVFIIDIFRGRQHAEFAKKIASQEENRWGNLPAVTFMASNFSGFPTQFPLTLSTNPVAQNVLFRLAQEGGVQRGSISLSGKLFLFLARPLRNLEYLGFCLAPDPDYSTILSGQGFSRSAVAFYLFIIILATTLIFRRFYLDPIGMIQKGVNAMASGNYEIHLPILSKDELGMLSTSFNKMAEGLKEKEFMSRFLSDLALEAVKKSGKSPATRLKGTIMFSDIRGFTTMSESMPGEVIVDMLNDHLTRMEEVIEKWGGSIDKFIGDAVMAVFLPVHGKPHPAERAAHAGIEMIKKLNEYNNIRREKGEPEIRIGVGIATGNLLMGTLGRSSGRQDFTVTGPTVNLAAGMEKRTKEASKTFVVVCEQTSKILEDSFACLPLPSKAGAAPAFEIVEKP